VCVIRDVDATLTAWLSSLLPRVTVACEAPPEIAAPPKAPRLSLFLDDVREDPDSGTAGWAPLRGEDGVVVGRLPPAKSYRLVYLLIAQALDASAEHDILGRVLAGTALHEAVPSEFLTDGLAETGQAVLVRCAPASRTIDPRELWAGWGVAPRTTLELSVLAPLPLSFVADVASPPKHIELGAQRTPPVPVAAGDRKDAPRPTGHIHEG
jgi:hypothetical protein